MKKKLHWHVISHNETIKDAMVFLNKAPIKTLLVLNKKKLVATLSDGDIRRGLISGKKLDAKVIEICNFDFKYVNNVNDKYTDSGYNGYSGYVAMSRPKDDIPKHLAEIPGPGTYDTVKQPFHNGRIANACPIIQGVVSGDPELAWKRRVGGGNRGVRLRTGHSSQHATKKVPILNNY